MPISNWIIFGALEFAGLLLLLCLYLLLHTRNLKQLIKRLQNKLLPLISEVRTLRQANAEMKAAQPEGMTYEQLLDEQLEHNRQYHASLNPDQDIALDLEDGVPLPRQVASMRHAILTTEKEAYLSSDTSPIPHWPVIQAKFQQLMEFFRLGSARSGNNDESLDELKQELAERDQRIANLEQFKRLFFELEEQWQNTQQQADGYQQQLRELASQHPEGDTLDQLLQDYQQTFNSFGDQLAQGPQGGKGGSITQVVEKKVPNFQPANEVEHLKTVAANQHKLIAELQHRLSVAYSAADKEAVIQELKGQLEQQVRFMEESETCIQLLEEELDKTNQQLVQMEKALDMANRQVMKAQQQGPKTERALLAMQNDFKEMQQERNHLNKTNKQLQQENEQLMGQLQAAMKSDDNSAALKKQLKQVQQQYTELEGKYLALRMKP